MEGHITKSKLDKEEEEKPGMGQNYKKSQPVRSTISNADHPNMDTTIGQLYDITVTLEGKTLQEETEKHPCPKIAAIEILIDNSYAKISAARKLKISNTLEIIHKCDRIELETLLEIERLRHERSDLVAKHLESHCIICEDVAANFEVIDGDSINGSDSNGAENISLMQTAKIIGKYAKSTALAVGFPTPGSQVWGTELSKRKLLLNMGSPGHTSRKTADEEVIHLSCEDEDEYDKKIPGVPDEWELV